MRYVVLLRYGLGRLHTVLKVGRSDQGEISCFEAAYPYAGMTWSLDGRFRLTTEVGGETGTTFFRRGRSFGPATRRTRAPRHLRVWP